MKPCTRATLFRLVLAIRLFDAGLIGAGRYVLPQKYKLLYFDPFIAWQIRKFVPIMLETLKNNFVAAQLIRRAYDAEKIGDTLMIRKSGRIGC